MGVFDKAIRCAVAVASTFLVAYPFYALIGRLSVLDPPLLQPCNDGCTFIRYWGSPGLPRSAARFIKDNDTSEDSEEPIFVTIRNGDSNVTLSRPNWYSQTQRDYTHYALLGSDLFRGGGDLFEKFTSIDVLNETNDPFSPSFCKNISKAEMRKLCELPESKESVQNHLGRGSSPTLQLYLLSIPVWAFFRVAHDWLLITEVVPEKYTLVVGYLSALPQLLAVASGFLWCIGAAEVFRTFGHPRNCACYYEMEPWAMFAVIATPVGLYLATRAKVWHLAYATLHGDHLYTVKYSVPYRAANYMSRDPTYDFLSVAESRGASLGAPLAPRKLSLRDFSSLRRLFNFTSFSWNFTTLYFVYAFAFPTLTVRFYDVVLVNFVRDGYCFEKFGASMLALFFLGLVAYVYYKQGQRMHKLYTKYLFPVWGRVRAGGIRVSSLNLTMYFQAVSLLSQFVASISMCWIAALSTWLAHFCYRAEEVGANYAADVGAGGFFILVAVLNSCVPSDTDSFSLSVAMEIKCGGLPMHGLKGIVDFAEEHKHLGLQFEAGVASDHIQTIGNDSPLVKCGWFVDRELRSAWDDFFCKRFNEPRS